MIHSLALILALSTSSPAKRMIVEPPKADPRALPSPEMKHLAHRVAEQLLHCGKLKNGAEASIYVDDTSKLVLDSGIVSTTLQDELAPKTKNPIKVEVRALLSFREWKTGPYTATFTLKAKVLEDGKQICEGLHRTVKKRTK